MPTPPKSALLNQLHSLRHTGFAQKLDHFANQHAFPKPFFFAIASRETNCINELGDPRNGEFPYRLWRSDTARQHRQSETEIPQFQHSTAVEGRREWLQLWH